MESCCVDALADACCCLCTVDWLLGRWHSFRMLLRVCSVGSNKLGPAGARYMADALRENSTLQRLE